MIVPVGGTWSEGDPSAWFRPTSVWCANLRNAGLALLDDAEPYEWSTSLAVSARDPNWRTAGLALKWYLQALADERYGEVVLVGHSHGGNVLAHALAIAHFTIKAVVTAGTPSREDMDPVYAEAMKHTGSWTQLYCDEVVRPFDPDAQPYQLLGCVPCAPRREIPGATNVKLDPPTTHHGLFWPQLWNDKDLWKYLR